LRKSLLWKLLGVNVLVIVFVISVVWLAINYLAAGYFMILMEKYHISPTASHQMFVGAVHRYLIWASVAAFVFALAMSTLLMRRVLRRLMKMTSTAQRIAEGDYTGEVPVVSDDEVGRLSEAFNRMSASLRHTEQLRKRMVIDVAHELRTPLTNIKGYLEALADDVLIPSRETFQLLQEETVRLTSLVEDIMRLARADAARADLHRVEIEAGGALVQMVDGYRRQFEARRITVKMDQKDRSVRLSADPEKFSQIVSNLLQNASRYTPEGGALMISIERMQEEALFVFSNTGGELEDQDLPFIFERFYRGEKSRSREYGGAGIGLAVVKELVEAHGGHVGAELVEGIVRIWFSLPATLR
jgi:two-component system, OmpR family, sensor histidine kinase BaeS